jgi:hypothetical protein
MKKFFVLSLLIPFALVCSCQKRDVMAEQQLAQRKTDLDAREKALDEREKALADREKLAAKPRAPTVPRTVPAQPQRSVPPELQGLIADPSRDNREQRIQERLAERQRKIEEIQKMRAARARPRPQASPQATAEVTEAASPSPSPTPE